MGDACMDCKSWEEGMYWTHFQAVHFSLFLHGDFTRRLEIPQKVIDNLRGKLPEILVLKSPGAVTWKVGLGSKDNTLFFEHGWEEFIKDNSLKENDLLIFKYEKQSSMDVLMFDGESLCEKESSYFVRKCSHTKMDPCYRNMKAGEDVVDATPAACPVAPIRASLVQSRKANNTMPQQIEQASAARVKRFKTTRHDVSRPLDAQKITEDGSPSDSVDKEKGNYVDTVNEEMSFKKSGSCTSVHVSQRRAVTEEEKRNALQLAQAATTAQSFLVVMRPTHVYKRFFMDGTT